MEISSHAFLKREMHRFNCVITTRSFESTTFLTERTVSVLSEEFYSIFLWLSTAGFWQLKI